MKKILSSLLVLTMAVGLTACTGQATPAAPTAPTGQAAPAADQATPEPDVVDASFSLRMADNQPDDFPSVIANREFIRLAYENTGGSIDINLFSGGVLGDEMTTLQQVQLGAIDLIRVPVSMLAALDEAYNVLALPFMWSSRESMTTVLDGEVGDYFRYRLNEVGLHGLAWYYPGARHMYNTSHEILTPADMAGMRIRVQENPMMMNMISLLGGSPTPMAFGEVYAALQTGVIEGAENNWPSFLGTAHYEISPFISTTAHLLVPEMIVINLGVWNDMSASQQETLQNAAYDGALFQREEWVRGEIEAEEAVVAGGAIVTHLTPEQRQPFQELVMPLYDDFPQYRHLIDKILDAQ